MDRETQLRQEWDRLETLETLLLCGIYARHWGAVGDMLAHLYRDNEADCRAEVEAASEAEARFYRQRHFKRQLVLWHIEMLLQSAHRNGRAGK